jgi:NAD(P)-dependent dehydrogenase (short-subunit alcohol dehydrogenase family)
VHSARERLPRHRLQDRDPEPPATSGWLDHERLDRRDPAPPGHGRHAHRADALVAWRLRDPQLARRQRLSITVTRSNSSKSRMHAPGSRLNRWTATLASSPRRSALGAQRDQRARSGGRALLRNGGGAVVNIASMSGTIVNHDLLQVHYNASKAAVVHMSKSLAMEWADRGSRVNSISPGYTATPMNTRPEVAEQVKRFAADTPLGRMATPEEMIGPAVFLLSAAASFCTGVDLLVDGGFVCW